MISPQPAERVNLFGLERTALEALVQDMGSKPFRARQLMHWIYKRGEARIAAMTDLAKDFRLELAARELGEGKQTGLPGERIVTNVVLMGMGEPLANFRAVVPALRIFLDDYGFDLSRRRVTLSTSGLAPQLYKLAQEVNCALAVSLHAPD